MSIDVSYLSIDSVQEGVGASQIQLMLFELAKSDLKLNLITFEKNPPNSALSKSFRDSGVLWTPLPFKKSGSLGGLKRIYKLKKVVMESSVLHCRSDLPTLAGILSEKGPVLWDIRSLWREQRKQMNPRQVSGTVEFSLMQVEKYVASKALAMNTLTHAIVPILEKRHAHLPKISSVIPTCVNLDRFRLRPFPGGRIRMLISGNLNGNYDTAELNRFIIEMRKHTQLEVVWATDVSATIIDPIHDIKVRVQHGEMPDLIASCHFGVAFLHKTELVSLAAAMPTKIAEFLAVGRPVVLSSGIGDFDQILDKRKAGLTFENHSEFGTISEELIELINNNSTVSECRKIAEEYFNISMGAQKYLQIYSKLSLNSRGESF